MRGRSGFGIFSNEGFRFRNSTVRRYLLIIDRDVLRGKQILLIRKEIQLIETPVCSS